MPTLVAFGCSVPTALRMVVEKRLALFEDL
jgi:hypothetical protein